MEAITFEAQERAVGKSAARAVRRAGNVPCIMYGHHTEPLAFQLPEEMVKRLVFTSETHVVEIELNGKSFRSILKDAVLHPVTDRPMHADFMILKAGEMVSLLVPVHFGGTPVGQKEGGVPHTILHELEIRCLPKDIPTHIGIDISDLALGDALHIGDLDFEGVEFTGRPDQTIVAVVTPRVSVSEEEVEEEEEVGEESAAEEQDDA